MLEKSNVCVLQLVRVRIARLYRRISVFVSIQMCIFNIIINISTAGAQAFLMDYT
jgi:hypothetical protein